MCVVSIHNTHLYTKAQRSNAESLGARVVTARWIDIDEGDAILENYRSRLVSREAKEYDKELQRYQHMYEGQQKAVQ